MALYEKHVFVCTTGKICPTQGSQEIRDTLKAQVKQEGLAIRVNNCGCLGQCGRGPNVVVYPEGTWYEDVSLQDVPEIVESLKSGERIERLLNPIHHPGGAGKPDTGEAG